MKRTVLWLMCVLLCCVLAGCGGKDEGGRYEGVPAPIATITMQNGSVMRFELDLTNAPNTVANFAALANSGFYDGLEFFRIKPNGLIQSGCPNNDGTGTAGYTIPGEFSQNGHPNNLSHVRGVISMARRNGDDFDSASSQFFIMAGSYTQYDGYYAAFGHAMDQETLDTINAISNRPVDANNMPMVRQVIDTVRVDTHGYELELTTLTPKDD